MRIGFLINTCEPFYRGGYERRTWSFARELARLGHDVCIYTSCPSDETIEGVRFVRLGARRTFFNRRGVRNGWADVLFALSVVKLLWKLKPGELEIMDVCATPFLHLPFMALVGRMRRIPCMLTCHEALLASLPAYARERGHATPVSGGLIAGLLAAIYRLGMSLFPLRIGVSHRTAAGLEREGYPLPAVVEFGLEPEAFCGQEPEPFSDVAPVNFIYCGRLTPIKSVDQSLAALLALRSDGAAFRFDIIGEGSERERLEQMVREAKAGNAITFHGEVSETVKRTLLVQGEIFVLSSPREGFSIATLEAMAQGCAAVVVSNPQQPNGALDFVRDGTEGVVVPAGVDALQEALKSLIKDSARRLRLRRAAWKTAHNYRLEVQALRLVDVYRR